MELTDENLDYPDCRPLNPNVNTKVPDWLEEMVRKKRAEREGSPLLVDHNGRVIDSLGLRWPGSRWDVLRGVDAPEMAVCGSYNDIWEAHGLLEAAGCVPCRHSVPAPELDGPYDLTTVLRFSAGDGQDVILVRRTHGQHARAAIIVT